MLRFLRRNKGASATQGSSGLVGSTSATTADTGPAPGTATPTAHTTAAPVVNVQKLLHRLEWTALRRLDGVLQGDYRTLFRGSGFELADLREYQPHDDVRHIDWNVTARMQTPYVREHLEDREITGWFVLDLSGSMDFGSAEHSKREKALELVGVLARILTRRGNPVGALMYSGQQQRIDIHIPPATGKRHVLHLMDRMARVEAPARGLETDLGSVLQQAASILKRRATVVVVSDFISRAGWEGALSQLSRRHDVVAVRLRDPLEHTLHTMGMVMVRDAETGEELFVDTLDPGIQRRFAEQSAQRELALQQAFSQSGVDCLELHTQEPIDAALLDFIRMRKPRARMFSGTGTGSSISTAISSSDTRAAGPAGTGGPFRYA